MSLMMKVQTSSQKRYVSRLAFAGHGCYHLPLSRDVWDRPDAYLEAQPRLHLISQDFSDGTIEVLNDAHGELRIDALVADQVVQRVRKSQAAAIALQSAPLK